ncbi:MAG TPA: cytochrome P450, partial [Acidimicrobiales bacterium]
MADIHVPDIDLNDIELWSGPLSVRDDAFARLRAEQPIAWMGVPGYAFGEAGGYWSLTRHAHVLEASKRPEDFCSGRGTNLFDMPPDFLEFFGSMINMDDPKHARLRRIVSRGFTARKLDEARESVERAAAEIVEAIAARGECDFVTDVAALLPLRIIMDMLGIPRSYEELILERTNRIVGGSD